ncbi:MULTISPECIES: hypothetical protein [unclassified Bradyrhizobium]|uniref:hypothetical protein n=1 Tax=unclassified Bradyrhizobium TaxID=2631580 RepID=UPI00211EFA7A|nr:MULTISPECIES: hypothetical protein [unclassified Bradyrhizobium]
MFGFDLDGWNAIRIGALVLAAAAGIGSLIANYVQLQLQRAESKAASEALEKYKADAAREIEATKLAASSANERTAQLNLDLEKERRKTAPRPWTKEQFEAVSSMKGRIPAVGILSQRGCLECILLANHLTTAFRAAGAEIYGDPTLDLSFGTGLFVFLPPGSSLNDHPVVLALKAANYHPASMYLDDRHGVRMDVPIVVVGEKYPEHAEFPFFPGKMDSFTIHPLRR